MGGPLSKIALYSHVSHKLIEMQKNFKTAISLVFLKIWIFVLSFLW